MVLGSDGIRVDGQPVEAYLEVVEGTPIHVLRLGTGTYRLAVQAGETRGRYTLWSDERRFEVEALDERTRAIREMTARTTEGRGPASLVAPMPGLIVRVNVQPGDTVQAGQGLVVMEAMKMENELRAAAAGTVASVRVSAGVAVEKGTVLVELQ